nr:carboxypeptidase-like regulatory domain-containing protein [Pedobacter panaciterrae]
MTLKLSLSAAVFILLFSAFIEKDVPIDQPIGTLQKQADTNIHEKVHLHFDKPYYAQGDTIWFKAYVVIGSRHQLSAMSGALYVELINEKDSLISALKLPVTAGTTMGDFVLDQGVQAGNYRIRAYTQWMRNAGEDYFFDQTFMVASVVDKTVDATKNTKNAGDKKKQNLNQSDLMKSDVQFFPEGGVLVNGITSRMGFKVVGTNGLGMPVKGVVLDQENKAINTFETLYAGMGSFNIRPDSGKTYTAKIILPDGSEKIVPLPNATDHGYVLGVYQPNKDSILVRINTNTPGETLSLIARSGGETIFSSRVNLSRHVNSIWMEKKAFPSGITQFTLFNDAGEPTNERITFIKTNDKMQLKLSTAKKAYTSREPVTIELNASDAMGKSTRGSFSVSVIDESKVPSEQSTEHTIFSNLLLSSDLKGYIENPNYYFTAETEEVNTALDNLMLTQGYRNFDWRTNHTATSDQQLFPAEGLGTVFSGKVLTLGSKPLPNAAVTMMSLKAELFQSATTDSEGRFKFGELILGDSLKVTIQAKTPKNGTKAELVMDSIPKIAIGKNKNSPEFSKNIESSLKVYTDNSKKLDSIYEKTGQLNRVQRLREVNIRARKTEQKYASQGMFKVPDGHSDRTIDIQNIKTAATLDIFLQGKLGAGVKIQSYTPGSGEPTVMSYPFARTPFSRDYVPMSVILDGRKLSPSEAAEAFNNIGLQLSDISKIEVVTTNMALIATIGRPAIFIYTKKDKFKREAGLNMVNLSPKGFNKVKTFYSPKYDVNNNRNIPDLRSTIYWNPNVKTYDTGKTSFSFFNADGPGKYKVIIEGINSDGLLGREVFEYSVEQLEL